MKKNTLYKKKVKFDFRQSEVQFQEGFMSLMKGAGANILRGVAGAGVLAGFDKFQALYIAWRTAHA